MRKYQWLISVFMIGCTVLLVGCEKVPKMLDPVLPEVETVEPITPEVETVEPVMPETQMGDSSMLTNSLIIAEAKVVNTPLPETSNSPTAPQIEGNLPEVTASVGSIILLPFEYSGTNTLAGCIVYIPGVAAYYEIPYTGGPDDLPSAIPVSLSENVSIGSFIDVCYGVYDDQGQTSNFLNTVVTVVEEQGIGIFDTPVTAGNGLFTEAFVPGVRLTQVPDFDTLMPFRTWTVANIDVPNREYTQGFPELGTDVLENFGIRLRGRIKIETAGTYNFKLNSDDGSILYVDGNLVIDNDGLHPMRAKSGSVMLTAGFHDVEIGYFQGPRTYIGLQWFWQPPGGVEAIVPPGVLYPPNKL